jgi:hypothetical protein
MIDERGGTQREEACANASLATNARLRARGEVVDRFDIEYKGLSVSRLEGL